MRKFIKSHGKQMAVVLTVLMLFLSFANSAYAIDDIYEKHKKGNISDKIKSGNNLDETEILKKIDDQVSNIVATVRVIATIAAVVFVIWLGIIFFTSGGNPQRLMQAKTQVAMFFLSLVCIFLAEPIVRFILSWFN